MKGDVNMKYAKYPKLCKADYKVKYVNMRKAYLLLMSRKEYDCKYGEIKHKNKYCSSYYWGF